MLAAVPAVADAGCMLCAAERLTEWFYEDEVCWVAECEQCCVPMVVWKEHDAAPHEQIRNELIARLVAVVECSYRFPAGHYIDDNMRSIPDHYHAHARPRGGFFGHGLGRSVRM